MSTGALDRLDELLSLETAPASALTPEDRAALNELFETAEDEAALSRLSARVAQALNRYGENLRAIYATGLWQELTGDPDEAGKTFHRLGRDLARKGDWAGARELALRALPLRPDYRVVRLLLETWEHLPAGPEAEEDLSLAEALCPESPDLAWRAARQADADGLAELAEEMAVSALARFVAVKEPDRAEEPLLRILESPRPRAYRGLLRVLPRMAAAGLPELLATTLELADEAFSHHGLKGELARTLERIILRDKRYDDLRGRFAAALAESLGGSAGTQDFLRDCGLLDPNTPFDQALERFRSMYNYRPGAFVEHHNLGVGRIAAHDNDFLVVDFAEKPGHRMALEIAARSLRPVPEGCLRAARFAEPETIAREIESDPVSLLSRALAELGGQAGARELRDCLAGNIIPEADWSNWWKRARDAAQKDPRVDTSQAYRQIYRLPGAGEEEEVALPGLPAKGGAQSATNLIERLLKQHPEFEERARAEYAEELAARALSGRPEEGVTAVPLLLRWLPERSEEWTAIAQRAFHREPGVSAGVTAEQQAQLLDLGLAGPAWQDAALTALPSRYPAIRERALLALQERLGERLSAELGALLLSRAGQPNIKLAIVRLALQGALNDDALGPWELMVSVLGVLASEPPQKIREAALELLDPQEPLAARLRVTPSDEHVLGLLRPVMRDLANSETGLEPLVLLLRETGHSEVAEGLRREMAAEMQDPVAIHFDPKITLMTRATFEQNQARINDLQRELSRTIPQEIAAARSLGDLSENAEYHAARERQGIADAALRSLRSQMENARVIEDTHFPEGIVVAGTEVAYNNLTDGTQHTVWLLGQGDSVQDPHVINYRAPLGQALIGKRAGEVVDFETNGARQRLEIVFVRKRHPVPQAGTEE